ncbi:MAG: RNA methyltransferase [Myxococcales bacterium]|nr:RNA methyltransferase [Myxococcales bacterium]
MALSRFDALLAQHDADHVVGALAPFVGQARRQTIERVLAARLLGIEIVLEDLFDPRNAAAVMRTAEAFGVYRLHISDPNEEFRPAKTVTKGCHRWLEMQRHRNTVACIEGLRAAGVAVWAAALEAPHTMDDIDVSGPVAVVFGNEHRGVSPDAQAACTGTFSIPMVGFSQSLNISAAAAIAIHALTGRRRAELGGLSDLTPSQTQRMRAQMLAWSVREPEALVAHYALAVPTNSPPIQSRSPDDTY